MPVRRTLPRFANQFLSRSTHGLGENDDNFEHPFALLQGHVPQNMDVFAVDQARPTVRSAAQISRKDDEPTARAYDVRRSEPKRSGQVARRTTHDHGGMSKTQNQAPAMLRDSRRFGGSRRYFDQASGRQPRVLDGLFGHSWASFRRDVDHL